MSRIFKYQLEVKQRQLIYMPAGAKIISGRVENEFPHIYAIVDEDSVLPAEGRIIRAATTGEEFNEAGCRFIDSLVIKDWFVFHVFEQDPDADYPDPLHSRFIGDYRQARQELRAA